MIALIAAAILLATFPAPDGFVTDPHGVLSAASRQRLEEALAGHERSTTNEVAVAVIPTTGADTIEDYALALFNDWGIGKAGRNNGVLLLVAVSDRRVRIQTGTGLAETFTPSVAQRIIDNDILPRFRAGDMQGGILAGAAGILEALGGAVAGLRDGAPSGSRGVPVSGIFMAAIMGLVGISGVRAIFRGGRQRCPLCQAPTTIAAITNGRRVNRERCTVCDYSHERADDRGSRFGSVFASSSPGDDGQDSWWRHFFFTGASGSGTSNWSDSGSSSSSSFDAGSSSSFGGGSSSGSGASGSW